MKRMYRYLFLLMGFSIPVTTALTNILLGLIVLVWVGENFKTRFSRLFQVIRLNPVALAGLVIFSIYLGGSAYSTAGANDVLEALRDGLKFLFIPMMAVFFTDDKLRTDFMAGFIFAMLFVLILSCGLWLGLLPDYISVTGHPEDNTVFFRRITQNIFMAFTAFTFAVWARFTDDIKRKWLYFGLSFLALVNVFFMVPGRTGHLVMLVLMGYFVFTWRSRNTVIAAVAAIVMIGGTMMIHPSNPLVTRAVEVIEQVREWEYGRPASDVSSSGLRLEFYTNSLKLIKKNPVAGTGTGSFEKTYYDAFHALKMNKVDNPHNDYLMISVQFGIIGLLALLLLFALQWRSAGYLPDRRQEIIGRGFVLTMMCACMVSSPIIDHAEGWFFAFMSAAFFPTFDGPGWYPFNRINGFFKK